MFLTDEAKTCAEINAALATAKGWTEIHKYCGVLAGTPPDIDDRQAYFWIALGSDTAYLPDSCGDWKHAGPWLEELLEDAELHLDMKLHVLKGPGEATVSVPLKPSHDGYPLIEAVARAAEAMLEGKGA